MNLHVSIYRLLLFGCEAWILRTQAGLDGEVSHPICSHAQMGAVSLVRRISGQSSSEMALRNFAMVDTATDSSSLLISAGER